MPAFIQRILESTYMPHGHCYLWEPGLVWTHVVSDTLIGVAYVAITLTLIYLLRSIKEMPFQWMYLAFALFIVACGMTHFVEVWNVWYANYYFAAAVKVVTAAASVGTAILLAPVIPKARALAQGAHLAHERGIKLEAAHQELARLYEKTKELEALKTNFFANVSHELRTPLTLILGPVEKWLATADLEAELRRDLELIERNARTVHKHVNDLLDVSKLDAGKLQPVYCQANLALLVRVAAEHFSGLARERKMTWEVDAPQTLPAQLDVAKIERVLVNLIANAFKFTPDGGVVRVAVVATAQLATITVSDSGPGVPADLREAIFERFRQGDPGSTRRFGGTGLGLSIARDFVALHRGTIRVSDAPEGGARFTVELPLAAPPGVAVEPAPPSGPAAQPARDALIALRAPVEGAPVHAGAGPALVLVVEDNAEMRQFLTDSLANEYRVDTAVDGEQGLRKAIELKPDLVLSDVMMPGVAGDQLVRAIREHAELDRIPVVLLTAKADNELKIRMLREGAQDYLVKPFSLEELRARVGTLVARKLAEEQVRSSLAEKEVLLREIHHRVKNNLQVVSSLLNMQAADSKDDATRLYLKESQNRVRTMALIHEKLYESKGLAALDLPGYVRDLVTFLFRSHMAEGTSIHPRINVRRAQLTIDSAMPVGLIINELVSNALKHAFPAGKTGEVRVDLTEGPLDAVQLVIADDGVGAAKGLDLQSPTSLGLRLVSALVAQLSGTITVETSPAGTRFAIAFIDGGQREAKRGAA